MHTGPEDLEKFIVVTQKVSVLLLLLLHKQDYHL